MLRLVILCGSLLAAGQPGGLSAQFQEAEVSSTYAYGQTATFTLRLPEGTEISDAMLFLRVNEQHIKPYTVSSDRNTVTFVRDLHTDPFPPYSKITYWWAYTLASGTKAETNRQTFHYIDNRYEWQTVSVDNVTVHWITGDRTLMSQAVNIAQEAISQIGDVLQIPTDQTIEIFIYPSRGDLASAIQLGGLNWVDGVTYPELDVILIAVSPTQEAELTMQRLIPHELTHQILYRTLGPQGYAALPPWLNEGLATYFEGRPDPSYAVALQRAQREGDLIPLQQLCFPFPEAPDQELLAYAQSRSLLVYLHQTFGWSSIRELLSLYADGVACDNGIEQALGRSMSQTERQWRIWLERSGRSKWISPALVSTWLLLSDSGSWLLLTGLLLLPVLLFILVGRHQPAHR